MTHSTPRTAPYMTKIGKSHGFTNPMSHLVQGRGYNIFLNVTRSTQWKMVNAHGLDYRCTKDMFPWMQLWGGRGPPLPSFKRQWLHEFASAAVPSPTNSSAHWCLHGRRGFSRIIGMLQPRHGIIPVGTPGLHPQLTSWDLVCAAGYSQVATL